MMARTIGSLGLAAVVLGFIGVAACDDSSTPAAATAPEAGPGFDAGMTPADSGPATDTGTDACTSGPPPAGLTQLDEHDRNGKHAMMVLDEVGSPIVAYQTDTGAGGASAVSVVIRRWEPACSTWGSPIVVDTFGRQTDNGREIALAYDKSNGTVGVAYQADVGTFGVDDHYELRYAELKKGASAISPFHRVEDNKDNDHAPESPGLGMANGKVFVAYQEPYRLCNTSLCSAIVYRSRDAAGTWSAEVELPGNGPGGNGDALNNDTSVAVDSAGNPAVAWLSSNGAPGTGGVKMRATFTRPEVDLAAGEAGAPAPSLILDNIDTTGTDAPWIELAFDGTKPRAAVILNRDANYTADGKTAWFVASDDGSTWKTPVSMPHDMGSSNDLFASIAIGAAGKVVVTTSSSSGDGTQLFGSPKIFTSTDLTTFAVSGIPKDKSPATSSWVSSAIGADGKLQVVLKAPAGADPKMLGLQFYREP